MPCSLFRVRHSVVHYYWAGEMVPPQIAQFCSLRALSPIRTQVVVAQRNVDGLDHPFQTLVLV
eukprot:m.1272489 g.1272489  ORF g.1272489 m.1272489 type:complete len:63 (+) comp24751_c0_seq21:3877-4065(+)